MIESTSTLVRTESVKSRQSNNTTTSNDSVSYLSQYSNKKVFRSLSWVTCDGAVWQFICSFTFTCTLLHCIFNLIMISRVYGTASVVLRMNSSWTSWSSLITELTRRDFTFINFVDMQWKCLQMRFSLFVLVLFFLAKRISRRKRLKTCVRDSNAVVAVEFRRLFCGHMLKGFFSFSLTEVFT